MLLSLTRESDIGMGLPRAAVLKTFLEVVMVDTFVGISRVPK